jgi:O-methyltransferase involved in polyketide biosynthesis
MHKVHLTWEKETLLITLYAKALDYRSRHPILDDEKADQLVNSIDYDFERLRSFGNGNVMVLRARQLDEWVREFVVSNLNAIVLNIGCGLDSRVSRINPPSGVSWFDLDYPEVIELRRNFYSDREGYQMLESSVTQPEWLERVPKNRPVMVIADGVFEYLTEDEVKTLLNRLTDNFPHGQIVFDVMSSYAIRSGNSDLKRKTGAELKWAVDDIRKVDALDSRLKRTATLSVFGSKYLPLRYRLIYGASYLFPNLRNIMRLVRYEFCVRLLKKIQESFGSFET